MVLILLRCTIRQSKKKNAAGIRSAIRGPNVDGDAGLVDAFPALNPGFPSFRAQHLLTLLFDLSSQHTTPRSANMMNSTLKLVAVGTLAAAAPSHAGSGSGLDFLASVQQRKPRGERRKRA